MDPHSEHLVFAASHVAGFTKACAARGDSATFATLEAYFALAASAAEGAGGRFIKTLGDGVFLTFPPARTADAISALRTFQQRATELWRAFDARCHVQVRVGAGTVFCGALGAPGDQRFDVIGDAINSFFRTPWSDFDVSGDVQALLG